MSLPSPIIAVLAHFEPLFTAPTWKKVLTLLVGTLLARGRRTVTAALRQMGQETNAQFSVFHHVLTRDPEGKREPKAYFSTNQAQSAAEIVEDFVKRWPIEGTFEESRAHLGVETQRQWSDLALAGAMTFRHMMLYVFGQSPWLSFTTSTCPSSPLKTNGAS